MFARKLTPTEFWRARLNMAVAFESPFDYQKELEKSQTDQADTKEDIYGTFLSEDGDPIASIVMNHYSARFDGHIVKMGGVGGVATLPAERRSGAIRTSMELGLRDLYKEGYSLAYLYPFSTSYYRQFGFSSNGKSVRWKIALEDLRRLPNAGGAVRQLLPGDDLGVLLDIYNRAYERTNFSCLREVFDKDLEGDKPLSRKQWVYVWYDEEGTPGGFMVCSRAKDTLHCVPNFGSTDWMLFTGARALTGLLNFVHTAFIANFDDIEFSIPDHIDLMNLLPEIHDMNCTNVLNGMVRAVNAELLLKLCRCRGEGRIVLGVSDGIIPENNGSFQLDFAPGRENAVERTDAPADVELDVGMLSVLLGGARDTASLDMMPEVIVHNPDIDLGQVFYRKRCHCLDLF